VVHPIISNIMSKHLLDQTVVGMQRVTDKVNTVCQKPW